MYDNKMYNVQTDALPSVSRSLYDVIILQERGDSIYYIHSYESSLFYLDYKKEGSIDCFIAFERNSYILISKYPYSVIIM